jgi:probable rRNA maturation factor
MGSDDYVIHVQVEEASAVNQEGIEAAVRQALSVAGAETPCALTVTVTSAAHVQTLNREYAGIDKATDVLSFAAEDEPYQVEPSEPPYLGDIIIAYEVAAEQAADVGHSLLAEMQTLAIHGALHLLGFDHQDADQQAEMWAYESAAKDALRSTGK